MEVCSSFHPQKIHRIKVKRLCPVCSSSYADLLHTIHYPGASDRILPVEYRIVACTHCGMVYDDFDASEAVFAQYYAETGKYSMDETCGAGGNSSSDIARFDQTIDNLLPFLPNKHLSIADIGCGKGGLLMSLFNRGFHDLYAVDPSPGCIQYIKKHYPFKTACSDLRTYEPGIQFDLIICSQVLEHLFDPRAGIEAVRRLLKPGALFYCDLPDASRYLKYTKAPLYFFDQEHINHFYPATLKRLLESNGLQVEQLFMQENYPLVGFPCPNLAAVSISNGSTYCDDVPADYTPTIQYLQDSLSREKSFDPHLNTRIAGTGYLWGVGAYCLRLLQEGSFRHLELNGLIDLDVKKQGTIISGLRVFPPSVLKECSDPNIYVIITSVLYQHQIEKMLEELGFSGRVYNLCGSV